VAAPLGEGGYEVRIGKRGLLGLVVMAALLAMAFAVPALAETEDTEGPVGFVGGLCRGVGSMAASIADLFGMTPDELRDARVAGESLSDIATDHGVEQDALIDLMLQRRSQMLARAVERGRITQEEADQILTQSKEQIQERLDDPTIGPAGDCGGPGAPGAGCGGPALGGQGGQGNGNGPRNGGCIGADGDVRTGSGGPGCGLLGGPKAGGVVEPTGDGAPTVGTSSI
jgi:hypothetical protein